MMPSTPGRFIRGRTMCSYNKVEKEYLDQEKSTYSPDLEPLQDGKQMQQNGNIFVDEGVEYINFGLEDQMEVRGFVRDKLRTTISWIMIVISLGALRLVFHWFPHWMLYATHRRASLEIADKILVIERYQEKHECFYVKKVKVITMDSVKSEFMNIEELNELSLSEFQESKLPVHVGDGQFQDYTKIRLFRCKKIAYIWDEERHEFVKLRGLDEKMTAAALHSMKGISSTQQFLRKMVYGANEIIIPMRGIVTLLCLEVLNPFYVFQIFSFCLWIADDYLYYALCILAMSLCSIVMAVNQTLRNQKALWSRVYSKEFAQVIRDGVDEEITIPTDQLVPGDILVVPSCGCIMQCDAVLITGNCIVNESMLTGESVPVTKIPICDSPGVYYDDKEHSRHTLFSGTQVIQTRYYGHEKVYAVVIRTSFLTAKGSLVRSILYPPPVDFKFERDSYKSVQLLAVIAVIGVLYTIISKALRGNPVRDITLEALDLITIVVPPALPAAMTVGRMYAQSRLEKVNIFCISPRSINVSGSINCICFDKTGTLTEDGLDMWGVVPVSNNKYTIPERDVKRLDTNCHFIKAMVTCHSLTMIDGHLAGDPLDLKMFESTGWVLEEPEVSDDTKYDLISPTIVKPGNAKSNIFTSDGDMEMNILGVEVGIVRQFPFSSSLQRMSVVTRCLGDRQFVIYSKGSPEMIASLCDPSTIPIDFETILEEYTQEGYRVLGLAYRELSPKVTVAKVHRLSRTDAETNLIYLGLVVLENRLKPETTGVLKTLSNARLRTIMVTGDNMLTALSVARDCGIVPAGQSVVVVTATHKQGPNLPPSLHYGYHLCSRPSSTALNLDPSQITIAESIISFSSTTESPIKGPAANGATRNSFTIDIPSQYSRDDKTNGDYCFALTGQTWTALRDHYPDAMSKIATRGAVFARMSPDNKQQLIQELQKLGYCVAMVGDGANDCGALKAAHAGISLSEAESSIASPFTSKEPNISCIVEVIREGRTALVSSFSIFKYMAAYSLMQFASVIILYSMDSNLTDIQFLYIDLFIITVFAFVLGRVESCKGPLYPKPPQSSLISFAPIASLLCQMVLAVSCQLFSFYYVRTQKWYKHTANETTAGIMDGKTVAGYENYSVFAVSSLQYIILAMVFSQGPPYRRSVFHSPVLISCTILITSFTLYLIIYPAEWFVQIFETRLPPETEFRVSMTMIGLLNLILAYTIEYGCNIFDQLKNKCREGQVAEYVRLDRAMRDNSDWPKISLELPPREQTLSAASVVRPKPTLTVTPHSTNHVSNVLGSENDLDDLKYSTPMKSNLKIASASNLAMEFQSEDSLSKYLTPPTSPANCSSLSPFFESPKTMPEK